LVIYKSKLPAPSVSKPCDYRILQSPTKEQVLLVLLETVGRSQTWESVAPTELKKCVETNNPGLAPWAVQEYRPVGARLCFLHQSTNPSISYLVILMRSPWKGKHINKGLRQKIATAP